MNLYLGQIAYLIRGYFAHGVRYSPEKFGLTSGNAFYVLTPTKLDA